MCVLLGISVYLVVLTRNRHIQDVPNYTHTVTFDQVHMSHQQRKILTVKPSYLPFNLTVTFQFIYVTIFHTQYNLTLL